MISSSAAFQRTIRESHEMITKAVVTSGDQARQQLDIVDGNVRIKATNKFRRTADIRLSDPTGDLTPSELNDLLHPLSGNEVLLYRGARIASEKRDEYIQLGRFRIKDTEIMDSGGSLGITIQLVDLALRISQFRTVEPVTVASGTPIGTAIQDMITAKHSWVTFANDFTQVRPWITLPALVVDRATDEWELFQKWATDGGLDLFFDNEGQLVLQPGLSGEPGLGEVVWEFAEGELSTLLSLRRDLTIDNTYNYVMVYGQNTDGTPPVFWGTAVVGDHPLSTSGPLGTIPFFYSSALMKTVEQCEAVGSALLWKHLGHTEHVHFNSLVNPCLDGLDVCRVIRARSKVDSFYSLDNLTIPLVSVRAMECDTRERFISA